MPTMVRAVADERDALLAFLAEQRAGLRRAVHGLTDEQAAAKPSASDLCLGGLIKHATSVERTWMNCITGQASSEGDGQGDFRLAEGETVAGLLQAYSARAQETELIVAGIADLGQPVDVSIISPILPAGTIRSPRWILLHLVEETSRHAGHADIIRESLDGATAFELVAASGDPLFP